MIHKTHIPFLVYHRTLSKYHPIVFVLKVSHPVKPVLAYVFAGVVFETQRRTFCYHHAIAAIHTKQGSSYLNNIDSTIRDRKFDGFA